MKHYFFHIGTNIGYKVFPAVIKTCMPSISGGINLNSQAPIRYFSVIIVTYRDEFVCNSHITNTFEKGMNPTILSPVMDK